MQTELDTTEAEALDLTASEEIAALYVSTLNRFPLPGRVPADLLDLVQ
jgi:hypothetical protein